MLSKLLCDKRRDAFTVRMHCIHVRLQDLDCDLDIGHAHEDANGFVREVCLVYSEVIEGCYLCK